MEADKEQRNRGTLLRPLDFGGQARSKNKKENKNAECFNPKNAKHFWTGLIRFW